MDIEYLYKKPFISQMVTFDSHLIFEDERKSDQSISIYLRVVIRHEVSVIFENPNPKA